MSEKGSAYGKITPEIGDRNVIHEEAILKIDLFSASLE